MRSYKNKVASWRRDDRRRNVHDAYNNLEYAIWQRFKARGIVKPIPEHKSSYKGSTYAMSVGSPSVPNPFCKIFSNSCAGYIRGSHSNAEYRACILAGRARKAGWRRRHA